MNILDTLNDYLLLQTFDDSDASVKLSRSQMIAQVYAQMENSVSVLSDLKSNKSYIYTGGVAATLGIEQSAGMKEIGSIWEEDILRKIQEEDLIEKYALELRFFHLLKSLPVAERSDYQLVSNIRMRDKRNTYVAVKHRMFYIQSTEDGSIWLALCLYNLSFEAGAAAAYQGSIVNTKTGETIGDDEYQVDDILTSREKDVLLLIKKGKKSRDIAALLSISVNTVHRHRQNILEKLHVANSMEACRMAESLKLIS
ncbi:response regulator transcription factor [Chitinophaga varians]|uniref:response regulator transcription factor n=1 Tax=Chitinophaga varians TaxID=2202339 RepID=UPI00165F654D|nr:LuxR C-terminal-related transcriptional regulator [Chitinophaga varians]MBC9914256.1 response regulator transcription factor [Chitinophaga varians]